MSVFVCFFPFHALTLSRIWLFLEQYFCFKHRLSFNSVSFRFGVITMISGIVGVPLGTVIAQKLKKRSPRADPIICACGLIVSAPLIAGAMIMVTANTAIAYTLVFLGEVALNLNWAIVADILLVRFLLDKLVIQNFALAPKRYFLLSVVVVPFVCFCVCLCESVHALYAYYPLNFGDAPLIQLIGHWIFTDCLLIQLDHPVVNRQRSQLRSSHLPEPKPCPHWDNLASSALGHFCVSRAFLDERFS